MAYTEFNPNVKKVNLKPKGEVEIILTTNLSDLRGSVETLSNMIDQKVRVALESTVVSYNVQINTRTDKPIKSYKVDEQGIVSEIKPDGEQMELELGLAKQKEQIADIPEEISREVVDDFILSGLAPRPKGFYPIDDWIERIVNGDTYLRLANEYGMSSGRIVDLVDDYRREVAPLAAKWDEWRKDKVEQSDPEDTAIEDEDIEDEEVDQIDPDSDVETVSTDKDGDDIVLEDEQPEQSQDEDAELSDWEKEVLGKTDVPSASMPAPAIDDLDTFILQEKPQFEDIPFDFPALLQRKKDGETWMDIANSIGTRSSVLSAAFSKYKTRIKEQYGGAA